MNYADAFKIGSKCDGYIKGQYACIYIKKGGIYDKIFSIQNSDVSAAKKVGEISIKNPYIATSKITDDIKFSDPHAEEELYAEYELDNSNGAEVELEYSIPIVVASRFVEDKSFVPVQLNEYALEIIIEKLKKINVLDGSKAYKKAYSVYYEKNVVKGKGSVTKRRFYIIKDTYQIPEIKQEGGLIKLYLDGKLYGEYDKILHTEWRNVLQPKYDPLIASLTTDGIFYVKKNAFDWSAADIQNATITQKDENGNEIQVNLNDQLEAARKRLETAKAILATAATLTII